MAYLTRTRLRTTALPRVARACAGASARATSAAADGTTSSNSIRETHSVSPTARRTGARRTSSPSRRPTNAGRQRDAVGVRVLMRVDRELDFSDAAIHEAAALCARPADDAQYPIGAWPQRYSRFPGNFRRPSRPNERAIRRRGPANWPGPDYQCHYTLNDNSLPTPSTCCSRRRASTTSPRYRAAAERRGDSSSSPRCPSRSRAGRSSTTATCSPPGPAGSSRRRSRGRGSTGRHACAPRALPRDWRS